jgi:hypothetical protein
MFYNDFNYDLRKIISTATEPLLKLLIELESLAKT